MFGIKIDKLLKKETTEKLNLMPGKPDNPTRPSAPFSPVKTNSK
jgi:hypothetical protein